MSNIITFTDGKLAPQAVDYITAIETQMKTLKAEYDLFREQLQKAMEQNGILKIENGNLRITYVGETTREAFDNKKFAEDFPDLYNEYIKFSKVKASVRIKVEQ